MNDRHSSPTAKPIGYQHKKVWGVLLQEELAKARIREAEHSAEQHRMAHGLLLARRWRRLWGWTRQRALLYSEQL
ncbi:hypothetical protein [Goodfellowiella coeruleoviolacea]|uniref:Uncharacterized protein n=1 Tax=Goodfellowiella coeruleoviolacea TaxID=334858 RepID=A0AAE3GI65_9PSEU|nr:hypothetical protein [Goodfellowiella coeruleoviolacea]MCP2167895.1 hypothetical protein [Goodfellowiella coeruleoviolacea]